MEGGGYCETPENFSDASRAHIARANHRQEVALGFASSVFECIKPLLLVGLNAGCPVASCSHITGLRKVL